MPGLLSALAAVTTKKISEQRVSIGLGRVEASGDITEILAFQYYPETISDTKQVNYQRKSIPGASLPIYQWINSGERVISFTAVLSTDNDISYRNGEGTKLYDKIRKQQLESRNVDIRTALMWLRQYVLPTYIGGGTPLAKAPSRLKLYAPGTGIAIAGDQSLGASAPNEIDCVMIQCDATHEAFFPSGLPRVTTVQLSFAQIAQVGGFIKFPSHVRSSYNAVHDRSDSLNGYRKYRLEVKGTP